jgi:hypothetical protein
MSMNSHHLGSGMLLGYWVFKLLTILDLHCNQALVTRHHACRRIPHHSCWLNPRLHIMLHPTQVLDPSAIAHIEASALKEFAAATLDPTKAVLAASGERVLGWLGCTRPVSRMQGWEVQGRQPAPQKSSSDVMR